MQPILNIISNFDADKEYAFDFTYLGSERIITNELSIREDKKGSQPVYTGQSTKFDKTHILSSKTLKNGTKYRAKLRVKIGDSWSEWSAEQSFTCLSTPVFVFSSLQDEKFVYNNEVLMTIRFTQAQGDRVDTFQFVLMDENKVPITKFPTRRPLKGSPNILQERFINLVKGKLYYVGCHVKTISNVVHFESHEFIAHFVAPSLAGVVETLNQQNEGQILIQSYLKQTLGIQTRPYIVNGVSQAANNYIYLNGEKVVIPPDKPLKYLRLGMAKASDFVAKLWLQNIPNGLFLQLDTEKGEGVGMKFYKYSDRIVCRKEFLNEDGAGIVSQHRSNIVSNLGTSEFYLYIKVIEYRVQMKIVKKR
ncbi:hypothetical protein JXA27_06895 [Aerococcaceae bacterium zg-B36]|uniref:hypothetical protein n=1 Tax=Aerococcaceae bacterium zg-252 TaxID=2796928 RepID=UPI001BD8B858|nr:hypothetical protein [Aerococcaceae bacterium zg-B36]